MSKGLLVERIRNMFQGRCQPHAAQLPSPVQSEQNMTQTDSDTDTVAAIAAALHLSGRTESAANFGSAIAAAIAISLPSPEPESTVYPSDKKSHTSSSWSQYGREQIQNTRFRIFNRPVSSEKNVFIRQR